MNAVMGPAIRIRRSSGLVTAEALATAAAVEPDCEPGTSWAVVENDGVAHGVGEGALTVRGGEACKGSAAVSRNRCTGDVDRSGITAS